MSFVYRIVFCWVRDRVMPKWQICLLKKLLLTLHLDITQDIKTYFPLEIDDRIYVNYGRVIYKLFRLLAHYYGIYSILLKLLSADKYPSNYYIIHNIIYCPTTMRCQYLIAIRPVNIKGTHPIAISHVLACVMIMSCACIYIVTY